MKLLVAVDAEHTPIDVRPHPDGGWWVKVGDGPLNHIQGSIAPNGDLVLDGQTIGTAVSGDVVDLQRAGGRPTRLSVVDARRAALHLGAINAAGDICSKMPGVVVRVLVAVGQSVAVGDVVAVVEAMKMENDLRTSVAGVVTRVDAVEGRPVKTGALLVHVEEVP